MSKKNFNVFFVVLFLSSFCFIGCTDLLAPKAQTDINLNIDLSKIIKSSRNEGGSQGASSLGDNPTIKVAIYDAKDYDKATNSTENLTLITQAQASVGGDGIARVKLSDIPVGIDAIVFAELSFTDENSTQVVYAGNSGVFKVKASDNKVSLVLKKVTNSETSPDNTNTPYENYTLYKKTENGEEVSNVTGATISTSSTSETKVTVTNPDSSESVWTYFVKPENKTRFTKSGNYKVSVELKADKTTVVGIAAARADYFFTVNNDWTTCEFNTGYLIGNENHQFTIGLGLSSEIQIRNLKIEKLETTDTTEPSLVFDISRHAINSYLENNNNRPKKIVELTKETKFDDNLGYTITINAPLSHSATVQDVKLHLRSYATENTGANNVSFNITNNGSNDFETSVMADTASDKSISWNNNPTKISENNDGNFSVDFPNYEANDELIVDLITSSTSTSQDNSTSFTLSNFKVEKAGDSPFNGKIFAIQVGETWTQEKSVEVTIPVNDYKEFDVGMFNGWNGNMPSSFDDVTRFFYTGDTKIKDDLIYSVNNDNPNEPKFIITNDSGEDKIVKITLNENYEVVIEEVTGTTITSWDNLKSQIENLTNSNTTTEFVITGYLTATETITVRNLVKITSNESVIISRGNKEDDSGFSDSFFVVNGGNLELAQITLDGLNSDNISADSPLITVNSDGKLTLSNCTLQNNNSSGYGGAVYVDGGTLNFSSGTITKCNAKDGGGVYVINNGRFVMTGGTIQNCEASLSGGGVWMKNGCSFEMSDGYISSCTATSEGGGVFITADNGKDPSSFTMNGGTITRCTAQKYGGGGVSYGCGTNDLNIKFTMNGGTISECSSSDGGGVYLYGCFEMNGGTISDNTASNGAGVYVRDNSSSFTMKDGSISDNKASGKGGGVYLSHSTSSFTMTGGIIGKEIKEETEGTKQSWQYAATEDEHSNSANGGGGGIYAENGTVSIEGGKISYNYVPNLADDCYGNAPSNTACGGGIAVVKGNLTINNAEVSYNSGYQGGGIRCYNDNTSNAGTLTLNETLIKGNTSNPYKGSSFGGGLMVKNFNVNFGTTKSTIEQNFSGDGGAVFIEDTTSTLENIIIRNNSFNDNGYKYGSEMLLWDSAVISIASNTVDISNNEPADRKGIFINNSTDKLKLSGDISLASPIYLYFEKANSSPAVTVAGTLSKDTVATIKLVGSFATEGKLVLEAEEEVTLTEEIIAKFTLENEEFVIDSNGMIASAINYAAGITYDSTSNTLYISNEEGLAYFRDIVNDDLIENIIVKGYNNQESKIFYYEDDDNFTGLSNLDINGVLQDNIDLSNINWTPIGKTSNDGYEGIFNGNSYIISGLQIINSYASNPVGFFGSVYGGTVKNLVIEGTINSSYYTGGITGYLNNGTIENCVNKATITNSATTGTGGIVGYVANNNARITGCVNMTSVNSTLSTVGGIVGSTGDISGLSYLTISKCINVGEISGSSNVSGILGQSSTTNITISDCINLGKISANSTSYGYASGITTPSAYYTVSNSINVGEIAGVQKGGISSSTSSGTYENNYYDNTVNTDVKDSNISGITGKSTADLVGSNLDLAEITSENWSFAESRYPLPNIGNFIPGGEDGDIWKNVIFVATPTDISGGTGGGATALQGTSVTSETELITAIADTNVDTIIIERDFTITKGITIDRDITIAANSEVTLTDNVSDTCFSVTTGNLTIGGGAGKLIITNKTSYSTIQTAASNNKKTITIKNNASFENCTYYCISLAAIYYLNIEGGSFINNTYVPINIAKSTSAEITMTSGTITGNSHTTNGSSFYLISGKLTITGGTVKENKIGSNFKGAAIWVGSNATATVGGVTLTSNATYSSDIEL